MNLALLLAIREVGEEPCSRLYYTTDLADRGLLLELTHYGYVTHQVNGAGQEFWELTLRGQAVFDRDLARRRRRRAA